MLGNNHLASETNKNYIQYQKFDKVIVLILKLQIELFSRILFLSTLFPNIHIRTHQLCFEKVSLDFFVL